jgi:hypothetical protein
MLASLLICAIKEITESETSGKNPNGEKIMASHTGVKQSSHQVVGHNSRCPEKLLSFNCRVVG